MSLLSFNELVDLMDFSKEASMIVWISLKRACKSLSPNGDFGHFGRAQMLISSHKDRRFMTKKATPGCLL